MYQHFQLICLDGSYPESVVTSGWLLLFILNTSDSHYSEKTQQHASCWAYSCHCRMYLFNCLVLFMHCIRPNYLLYIFANCSLRLYSFLNSAVCCSVLVSCALGGYYQRKLVSNAKYNLQWKSSFVNSLLFVVVWIDVQIQVKIMDKGTVDLKV